MDLPGWWPLLTPTTRRRLMDHNGEVIPAGVVAEIVKVGGPIPPEAWWVAEQGPDGLLLSDEAVDLIEEFANAE